ncbi:Hypothetical protein GLP15_1976 [Giardia lamblia P15]|uniref:Uncharacterized protein n=1 Tax=Giardia intestinalis (strain P15) TaxID=658858 RepID=E1EWK3_GIAIA|nr:Hypothetical protein GLP15_1976 [Giardia lamblia P15]
MRLLFLFFTFHLAGLDAASPATFPVHMGKERLVTNASYTGRCTTTVDGKVMPIATFKLTVNTHSVNIIKRGYDATSHIGVMIDNPSPNATPNPSKTPLFAAGGFGSTQFGGSAAAFLYKPGPVFFSLSEGNTHYILDYDFVKQDYVATDKGGQSWYSLADPTLQAHWPKFNGKPYGPRPAERFIVVIVLPVVALMKENTSVEQLQQTITQTYQGVIDNFASIPGTSTLGNSTVCSVSLFVDYDIYWDVWVLALSISVSIIAITLVSVFKCCPCTSVKRIYYKKQPKQHSSDDSITAEPTDVPLEPIASEDTLGLADDFVDTSEKVTAL